MSNKKAGWFTKILVFIILCFFLVPLVWMALSAFKEDTEVMGYPFKFFPEVWTFENFVNLFDSTRAISYWQSFKNTAFVAIVHTVITLLFETMAGYAFARLEFPFKKLFWRITLFTMFIPGISIQLTSFMAVQKMGLLDNLWVLIVPSMAGGYAIFFYRQFFLNVPLSLEEAARIDGASRLKIYYKIFLPNAKGPMVLMGTGCFIGTWNSYVWPALTINSYDKYVLGQTIRTFSSMYKTSYGMIMAAAVIGTIPPLIVFMIFQKQIMKGMLISGLK